MSEEETKVEAATEAPATEGSTTEEAAPKKKGKKWSIVVGVVVVVLIAAGAGFWVWHEQPSTWKRTSRKQARRASTSGATK